MIIWEVAKKCVVNKHFSMYICQKKYTYRDLRLDCIGL